MRYFFDKNSEDINCYTLDFFKEQNEDFTLILAEMDRGEDFFYCSERGEVGVSGEGCGVLCSDYKPRNGKNGRCIHHKNTYSSTNRIFELINNKLKEIKNEKL